MKAKLIKKDNNQYLLRDKNEYIIGKTEGELTNKLSKQNCDELFGVVDVEKLARNCIKHRYNKYDENTTPETQKLDTIYGFRQGFNKAMELNKDKVFTLEDMEAIFAFGHQVGMNTILAIQSQHSPQPLPKPDSDKLRDKVIQSLQQPKEIEVEIETETKVYSFISNGEIESFKIIPKLDSEGCLVLRKL